MKLLKERPMLSFFLLAYAFTWWIAPLGSDSFPVFPYGPFVALLLVTGLTVGRVGIRRIFGGVTNCRVHPQWYAFALLVPLAIAVPAIFLMRLFGAPASAMPSASSPLEFLIVLPIMIIAGGPLGEELAWRGYVLPVLQQRHRAVVAVLILGTGHAIWHLPLFLTDEPPTAGPFVLGLLSGGVVLAWLWNSTGSILIPLLLHGANNEAEQAFQLGFKGADAGQLAWLVATGWAILAAIIIWRTRGTLAPAGTTPITIPIQLQSRRPRTSTNAVSAS